MSVSGTVEVTQALLGICRCGLCTPRGHEGNAVAGGEEIDVVADLDTVGVNKPFGRYLLPTEAEVS
ncbi:MAG: hypothetical protein H0T80_19135 [Betaproteobacteria bacterium]|nr:hypothetical protein [Betaproteobacteria bacterium]